MLRRRPRRRSECAPTGEVVAATVGRVTDASDGRRDGGASRARAGTHAAASSRTAAAGVERRVGAPPRRRAVTGVAAGARAETVSRPPALVTDSPRSPGAFTRPSGYGWAMAVRSAPRSVAAISASLAVVAVV